eukprot:TRINITY_DN12900_c0_g1_i1.p1 TRINITY_DN12900_c0_g1~~TRINITY_DN12900_c0_g1_i1.p1  ORF type:complete len:360 (-),score=88.74 TRINITY_DN12900_c0_g1_i1:968-2047(-)
MADALMAMGFTKEQAEQGLAQTGGNVQNAVEWIIANPGGAAASGGQTLGGKSSGGSDAMNVDEKSVPMEVNDDKSAVADGDKEETEQETSDRVDSLTVHNALCDVCKQQIIGIRNKCKSCIDYDLCSDCFKMRLIHHDPDHEFESHSEDIPTPEKIQLTEEQKRAAKNQMKQRLASIRQQREADEAARAKEREINRRQSGKAAIEAKKKWEEQQMQLDLEAKRKEKLMDKKAKDAIREKIRLQKEARRAKYSKKPITAPTPTPPAATKTVSAPTKNYDTCQVQIRQTDGKSIRHTFAPDDTLRVLFNWVSSNRTDGGFGPFSFKTTYPRKTYDASNFDSTTLRDAGLVPRGQILISRQS